MEQQKKSITFEHYYESIKLDPTSAFLTGSQSRSNLKIDIVYFNDSIVNLIKIRDNATEKRKSRELIHESNKSNSEKI